MLSRIRVIPVTLLTCSLILGLKVGDVIFGIDAVLVGAAEAQAAKPAAAPAPAIKPEPAKAEPADIPFSERDPGSFTGAELKLLASLAQRRDELEARTRDLEMRENLLTVAEKRIDEKIAELKQLEIRIKELVRAHDQEEENNLKSLVKVYENMKPKDAARIFEKLEMPVLLGVVERMREAKLAPVLAEMDPIRAQKVTVELATRKQLPGDLKSPEKSG